MIKVSFAKFNNKYKAYVIIGEKIFNNESNEKINSYIDNVIKVLQDVMHDTTITRIIYKSKDQGKTWYIPLIDKVDCYSNELESV